MFARFSTSRLGQFVIVRVVVSHRVELATKGSLEVKTTSQDTVVVPLAVTVVSVFVVFFVTGEDAPVKVKVSAERRTAPVQSPPWWSVNDKDPLKGAAEVTVPESFGSHVCAEEVDDVVDTVKHSFNPLSLEGR